MKLIISHANEAEREEIVDEIGYLLLFNLHCLTDVANPSQEAVITSWLGVQRFRIIRNENDFK